MVNNENDLFYKALMVEAATKLLVLKGIIDWEILIDNIDLEFQPTTVEEMEVLSEAVIYARCSILN